MSTPAAVAISFRRCATSWLASGRKLGRPSRSHVRREIAMNIGATNSPVGIDMARRLRAAEYTARAGGRERASTISRFERKAVDVHQQRDVVLGDLGHEAVEKVAVGDAGSLALIDRKAEMCENLALRFDDARIDVVPVERDDAVHDSNPAGAASCRGPKLRKRGAGVNASQPRDPTGIPLFKSTQTRAVPCPDELRSWIARTRGSDRLAIDNARLEGF